MIKWLTSLVCILMTSSPLTLACHSCQRQVEAEGVVYQTQVTAQALANKVWLFAVDGRRKPYSFLDENGVLVGFDVDFISKVCSIQQQKCEVVLAEFTECTITERTINYPGRGLMSGWFDGCPGYVISADREGGFDFTKPYLETDASFTVAPGNPSGFDPDSEDFSNFTLSHLTGAVTNSQCLTRLHKKFGKIVVAENLPDAKGLLLNGTVDVLFSPRSRIPDLEVLPQRVHCDAGGVAVMLKKGSELAQWWDPAFEQLVKSGEFSKLCDEAQIKYGANITCLSNALGGQGSPLQTDTVLTQKSEADDAKPWLFATSGKRKPFAYLDDEGKLTGFNVDFVKAVCAEANQRCEFVLQPFTECSFTSRNTVFAGRGLMDGWFDACVGYADSLDRGNAVDFTDAYLVSEAHFAVLPGNPSGFDPDQQDFSNFTITHLTGAYTNAKCLNRLKKTFGKIIIAANLPEAKQLLNDGKADVIFAPRRVIPDLDVLPQSVHCEQTGSTIMTKKGSPLVAWWNEAFRSFVKKGNFQQLCKDGKVKYQYDIRCLPLDNLTPDEIIG